MRKLLSIFLQTLTLVASLSLCACFDVDEEIWLGADGSGKARFRYTLPTQAVDLAGRAPGIRQKLETILKDQPGVELESVSVAPPSDRGSCVEINLNAHSLYDLLKLSRSETLRKLPSGGANLLGSLDVDRHGTQFEFTRTVRFAEALGLFSLGISREEREKRQARYVIHLPEPALSSNATETTNQGKTLIWQMSLAQALRQPVEIRFRSPIPLPKGLIPSVIVGILALLALGTISYRRFLRRQRTRPASLHISP